MDTGGVVSVEALETSLRSVARYVDNAKDMMYAYHNASPMYSTAWLSTIPNDITLEHVISPQPGTIYIVQDTSGLAKSARTAMLYDRDIKLYRLLDCNIDNDFEVRTLSESEEFTIPNFNPGNVTVKPERTHYTRNFVAGDSIVLTFTYNISKLSASWTSKNFIRVTAGAESFLLTARAGDGQDVREFSHRFDFEQDTTLKISYYKDVTGTNIQMSFYNAKIIAYTQHYNDYETENYVAPTENKPGFAGKLPISVYNTNEPSVFLSTGRWVTMSEFAIELKPFLDALNNTPPEENTDPIEENP